MNMHFTPELIDALALEGLNVVTAARGTTSYDYDVTGYRRVPRRNTPRGTFISWSPGAGETRAVGAHPECALDRSYTIRLGGMERGAIFTADAIGRTLRENRVLHCDGPGNGKWESALIAKKFGLSLNIEASSWNNKLPVTKKQFAEFADRWEKQAQYLSDTCRRLGDAAGVDVVDDPENLWMSLVSLDVQPLDIFLSRAMENYDEVNADFREEYGIDLPLDATGASPKELARRIKLWEYIRRRYGQLAVLQNQILRKYVRGRMVGNLEFDTEPDYTLWGQAYDLPGFNMRTALFEDEIGYLYWVGYAAKLSADLTHRAPIFSIRTNQVAAGPRIVSTREATRYWYGQAVRSGAGAFYLWLQDFHGDTREADSYAGPCMANPDESTRPKERWETHLEASKVLGETRIFRPPVAGTGILVSVPSCAAGGWLDVFSAYVETARARVHARFISSSELRTSGESLERLRLLFVPRAPFEHRSVIAQLRRAVEKGLTVIVCNTEAFQWDENGDANSEAQSLLGIESAHARETAQDAGVETFSLPCYRAGFSLTPRGAARVIGRFNDGTPAAVENAIGAGKVITLGAPMLDLYTSGIRDLKNERAERYELLRHWRAASGVADESWVFDVNLDNVQQVTGRIEPRLRPIDESVEFAPFLYVHGGSPESAGET